jgi:hypothetical protein
MEDCVLALSFSQWVSWSTSRCRGQNAACPVSPMLKRGLPSAAGPVICGGELLMQRLAVRAPVE